MFISLIMETLSSKTNNKLCFHIRGYETRCTRGNEKHGPKKICHARFLQGEKRYPCKIFVRKNIRLPDSCRFFSFARKLRISWKTFTKLFFAS